MENESCRDCANFEDRRNIEGVALCAMHHGPSVCCPEFKLHKKNSQSQNSYDLFCLECANYENVKGISICSKDHRPGVACNAFTTKS